MDDKVTFVIGPPRSGSTLLARMIGAHSLIYGRPEPHLLTPLAHLGYYAKVDKAPYDAVLAAEAQREFVAALPGGEQDYVDACRAYCDTLYGRMLATKPGKQLFLDKTPAYALVLDFIAKVYPTAKYVVLTRHPLAVFSSYAESFFNGDYAAAQAYNPILERYVPAIAKFLRAARGADLPRRLRAAGGRSRDASWPRSSPSSACRNEPQAVEYGEHEPAAQGLGDPIGVKKHSRPTHRVDRQVGGRDRRRRRSACASAGDDRAPRSRRPRDCGAIRSRRSGQPLDAPPARRARRRRSKALDRYRLERLLIVKLRALVQRRPLLRRLLGTVRLGADVLLRE